MDVSEKFTCGLEPDRLPGRGQAPQVPNKGREGSKGPFPSAVRAGSCEEFAPVLGAR